MRWSRILTAVWLLLAACGGGSKQGTPAQGEARSLSPAGPQLGATPHEYGSGLYLCPPGLDYPAYGDLVYPPGHPSRPPLSVRPNWCFASSDDAARSGYQIAPPPAGTEWVAGIYLVPPDPPIGEICRRAASRLGFPIPCPELVPAPGNSVVDCGPDACARLAPDAPRSESGVFLLEADFSGPRGYEGIEEQPGNHLFLIGTAAGSVAVALEDCLAAKPGMDSVTVRGHDGTFLECPPYSGLHGGHVVLAWDERGASIAISLHGHTEVNRQIELALADHLELVGA